MTDHGSVQATFAATIVDEWARRGVGHAVVCPGSRSTPLAVAVDADDRIAVHVHLDERSAAFVAVGLGRATGRPAILVTTSGTAAVEAHPAVVEAHEGLVPMLVCTADRPRRLWGVGAPQTIEQTHLYGRAVRQFVEPGVPDGAGSDRWRPLAAGALAAALGPRPGPVHLNLELDEPLIGAPGPLPPPLDGDEVPPAPPAPAPPLLSPSLAGARRGVVVAGGDRLGDDDVAAVEALGWPVLADPRSGLRTPSDRTVAAFDALLRLPDFVAAHPPDLVVQLGPLPASRALSEWLAGLEAPRVVVDPRGRVLDPMGTAAAHVAAPAAAVLGAVAGAAPAPDPGWCEAWVAADRAAVAAVAATLAAEPGITEPGLARALVAALADGTDLVVSSSMPVRDVEWWSAPRTGIEVHANRGANGIDGVTSTALGVALSGRPTVALVGDLAFLHDTNALWGLAERSVDLTVVVVDNRGGGIFSFLPQAAELGGDRFERLFGTPHAVDLAALARSHGVDAAPLADLGQLPDLLRRRGPRVLVARTDRDANVAVHRRLHAAVAEAVSATGR